LVLTKSFAKLKDKGWFYWATVVLLIAAGVLAGYWLEKQQFALQLRYQIYQFFTQSVSPRKAIVQRTVVVLIGDEEFWKGEPARRIPIKRSYLAKIVRALDGADPAVIAIDFDLRSQMPDGSFVEHDDYKKETDQFLAAVKDVSARRPVVLPRTIKFNEGYYTTESDIHDRLSEGNSVRKGYISLPFDYRKVPLTLVMKDGSKVDSFAEAIVRAVNEKALASVEGQKDSPYGTYLPTGNFTVLSSAEVLSPSEETLKKLRHNIVIIGAGWSNRAYGRGGMADIHFTPVGPIQGALLHANYVEALLDQRTAKSWGEAAIIVVDVILSFVIAVIFVLVAKLGWKLLSLLILLCFLALFSYFSWLNLGLFYDFFVPAVLVAGHSIYEQLRELRSEARKGRDRKPTPAQPAATNE
jgi:CHASE2 domain-containing sensor protein